MHRPSSPSFAAIAAVAAVLLLSGCGRKGPLDPPPSAAAVPQDTAAAPAAEQPASTFMRPFGDTSSTAPTAPITGQKRRLPMDVLID